MSKRRNPGEIVRRKPYSGFVASSVPELVQIPTDKNEADYCMMGCGDPECKKYANLLIISEPFKGESIYHISECQMEDI